MLSRDDILDAQDLDHITVEVPEWGGSVIVQVMTGVDRDYFERSIVDSKTKTPELNFTNLRAKLVARCVVDSEGRRLFTEVDVPALGKKSGLALQRVFAAAQKINGLTDDDVEELTEALKDDPSEGSGSD